MSNIDLEKSEIQHHESLTIDAVEIQKPLFPVPPTTPLIEFQKTMSGCAIGFASFALSSVVMGLYNTGLITNVPRVAIGIAFSYGSLGQYVASIIQVFHKDTFSAASFFTFASFYLAFGIMFLPGSGFIDMAGEQLNACMGLIEICYSFAALIFFLGTLKQPILIRFILFCTFLAFLFGAIGSFSGSVAATQAGGWFSFALGIAAWWALAALIYNENNTYIRVPFF
jgi:succinate-acetate transporter protein